jgi:hypothetical protein
MLRGELAFPFSGLGFEEPQAASCGAVFVGRAPARVGLAFRLRGRFEDEKSRNSGSVYDLRAPSRCSILVFNAGDPDSECDQIFADAVLFGNCVNA